MNLSDLFHTPKFDFAVTSMMMIIMITITKIIMILINDDINNGNNDRNKGIVIFL